MSTSNSQMNPVATIPSISFTHLSQHDHHEAERLLDACTDEGIFYLDMTDSRTLPSAFSNSVDAIYALSRSLFSLPSYELMRYDVDALSPLKLSGYKPLGRNRAGLASNKDGFETYAIPKDGVLRLHDSDETWLRPRIVDEYADALRVYVRAIHAAAALILDTLSRTLQIGGAELVGQVNGTGDKKSGRRRGGKLQDMHRAREVSSPDLVRLLHYPALQDDGERGEADGMVGDGSSHIAHTDLGSLTFLCTREWGLQIRRRISPGNTSPLDQSKTGTTINGTTENHNPMPASDQRIRSTGDIREWHFVPPPPPGHIIVNVGDMLSMLTSNHLRSCLHRVVPIAGHERYSFVYLMRAESDVVLEPLRSSLWDKDGGKQGEEHSVLNGAGEQNGKVVNGGGRGVQQRTEVRQNADARMTSEQWLRGKFQMLRGETWLEQDSWILTGSGGGSKTRHQGDG